MKCKWLIRVWFRGKNNFQLTTGSPASCDKGTQDAATRVFEVQPESRVIKSGTWWDQVREANAFTAADKARFEPLFHFCLVSTVLCSFLAARGHCSMLPRCSSRSDSTEKTEAASASDSRETKDKHNHSFAQHARCAQTPDPLSKRSGQAWTVEQTGLDRGHTVWL